VPRAKRANRYFGTDMKHIRTKIAVTDKSDNAPGLVPYKIVNRVRMRFSSVHNRRSARTVSRPRN
jgi:hypothetical protein